MVLRGAALAVLAAAAPPVAVAAEPVAQGQVAPRSPGASAAPWGVAERGPGGGHWLVRLWRLLVSLLQVPPGQPAFRDPFSVDDPQRPWRDPPRR